MDINLNSIITEEKEQQIELKEVNSSIWSKTYPAFIGASWMPFTGVLSMCRVMEFDIQLNERVLLYRFTIWICFQPYRFKKILNRLEGLEVTDLYYGIGSFQHWVQLYFWLLDYGMQTYYWWKKRFYGIAYL
jgi:hypothetical protein